MNYALITGAGSGIGFQYACELAARGYGIMVVSNNAEQNERAVAALRQEFGANRPMLPNTLRPATRPARPKR